MSAPTPPPVDQPTSPDQRAPDQRAPEQRAPEQGAPESKVRSLTPAGLVAGGAAAATASVIGGQLGVAGTVVGTFLTSVLSAAAVALYSDSISRGKSALRTVGAHARSLGARRDADAPEPGDAPEGAAEEEPLDLENDPDRPTRRPLVLRIVLLALAMAALGLAVIFGIQWAGGTELSHGTGSIQRSVTGSDAVSPRQDDGGADGGTVTESPSTKGDQTTAPGESTTAPGEDPSGSATPEQSASTGRGSTPTGDATDQGDGSGSQQDGSGQQCSGQQGSGQQDG